MKITQPQKVEIRCRACDRLLARGTMDVFSVRELELFCSRCKSYRIMRASAPQPAPHDGLHSGGRHDASHSLSI